MKILPREVEVIQCDGPGCENWCEAMDPTLPRDIGPLTNREYVKHYGAGCGWLAVPRQLSASIPGDTYGSFRRRDNMTPMRQFTAAEPLYFCSWTCFAAQVNGRLADPDTREAVADPNAYDITTGFHQLRRSAA